MTDAATQTPLRQAVLDRAIALLGSGWSHQGRGPTSTAGYLSFDWVGLIRDAVMAATNNEVSDLKDYTPTSITVGEAEDLMLSWGMRRIPVTEAREGDILICDVLTYGKPEVFGAVIKKNFSAQGRGKSWGTMVTARYCMPVREHYLMPDVRANASAFRIG